MSLHDDDLPALRAPAHGHRSDDAFARAVTADVVAHRTRFRRLLLAAVPIAAGAAAVVFAVSRPPVAVAQRPLVDAGADAGVAVVAVNDGVAVVDDGVVDVLAVFDDGDDGLLAFADADGDNDSDNDSGDFAIPGLAGSSERELEAIEAALDRALKL